MEQFKRLMGSKPVVAVVSVGATVFLAVCLLAAGFLACLLPASTDALASANVNTNLSAFSHDALVKGAQATRDYSFFTHDKHDLLSTVYEMNQELVKSGYTYPRVTTAPSIDTTADPRDMSTETLERALYKADDKYVLDDESISHLDDVYNVAITAYIALAIIFVLCIAAFAHVVFYRRWRGASVPFIVAGGVVLAVFALAGIAAAIDFYGFFMAFHTLFFTGESWVFPYDSLLICMLPQDFWIGMGAIWLATTATLSILSLILGIVIRKKTTTAKES